MSDLSSINILHAIACDDIRQEVTGKYILIGVYSGKLAVQFFPASVVLGFFVLARPTNKGDYDVELRIVGPEGKEMTSGHMMVHVQDIGDTALAIPPTPIHLTSPCQIILQYREGDGCWETICTVEARLSVPTELIT
jgi:hypothetical protein